MTWDQGRYANKVSWEQMLPAVMEPRDSMDLRFKVL